MIKPQAEKSCWATFWSSCCTLKLSAGSEYAGANGYGRVIPSDDIAQPLLVPEPAQPKNSR